MILGLGQPDWVATSIMKCGFLVVIQERSIQRWNPASLGDSRR